MIPDLSGVITPQDISTKGSGSYAADYVNWAKSAHLLSVHAPGWQFHLRLTPDGQHVWRAPNGTGFIVGYFANQETGEVTADFPQAIMDNRNQPIPMDKISARDLTDTHRRALCAAACMSFGLAYQLWARVAIEDPHLREDSTPAQSVPAAKVITDKQLKLLMAIAGEYNVTEEQQKEIVCDRFGFSSRKLITMDKFEEVIEAYKACEAQ